jgi:hypothetical protein
MSIQERCLQQRPQADRIFMDFKYTPAGSLEQQRALACLHGLILQWIEVDAAHDQELMKKDFADIKSY